MDQDTPDPRRQAEGWRLAGTTAGARSGRAVVVGGHPLILVPWTGEGWWAVPAACAGCNDPLPVPGASADRLLCAACGRHHAPDADSVPVLVVDDEIYVRPRI